MLLFQFYSSLHESLDVTCCWELFCSNYLVTIQGLPFDLRRSCRLNFSHFRSGWKLKFPGLQGTKHHWPWSDLQLNWALVSHLGLLGPSAAKIPNPEVQSIGRDTEMDLQATGLQKREVCLPCRVILDGACFSCLQSKLAELF